MQDLKVESGAIGMKNMLDGIGHLPLDGCRPLLASHIGLVRQTLDHDPILFISVASPIVKLGIGGKLSVVRH